VSRHLDILFEDHHCLAIAKRGGQFAQGAWAPPGESSLETDVRAYLSPAAPQSVYLGIVHRLDRPTSGVLVWAKTPKAARRISAQFEARRVQKEYWAVVEVSAVPATPTAANSPEARSEMPRDAELWTDWLLRVNSDGVASAVDPTSPGAREAVTRALFAQALSLPPGCAWLRLWPQTGRTHQLRIQAARRGMPVLGDSLYGSRLPFPEPEAIALHARSLRLRHPVTGAELALEAAVPSTWAAAGIVLPNLSQAVPS
jgi:23S rRNA pseudouridine1911/1915/1917 synthase